jgi:hypothetical protein
LKAPGQKGVTSRMGETIGRYSVELVSVTFGTICCDPSHGLELLDEAVIRITELQH